MSGDHNQYQKPDRRQCARCGKINPAEIHTCSPQWRYDPMTGEPLINGWPLYSGLPPAATKEKP